MKKKYPRVSGIYIIQNIKDGKVYIGKAVWVRNRLQGHISDLKNNKHRNLHLQYAWNKYGEEAFTFDILEEYEEDCLYSMENWWCNMLQAHDDRYGYNILSTSPYGRGRASEETKRRMSKAQKGHEVSKEARQKLSIAHTGKKLSPDVVEKIRQRMTGKPGYCLGKKMTEEEKNKRSRAIIQYDQNKNIIKEWGGIWEAHEKLGIARSILRRELKRTESENEKSARRKNGHKYIWRYKDVEINGMPVQESSIQVDLEDAIQQMKEIYKRQ